MSTVNHAHTNKRGSGRSADYWHYKSLAQYSGNNSTFLVKISHAVKHYAMHRHAKHHNRNIQMLNDYTPTCTTCKALCNTFSASAVAILASTRTVKLLQYIHHQHNMLTMKQ